jgi:hypothetical protein
MNTLKNMMFYLMIAVVLFSFMAPTCVYAQSQIIRENLRLPTLWMEFVPCADGGNGELILLSGDLHVRMQMVIDPLNGVHFTTQVNPQHLSGEGMTTGDKYQGTGITRETINERFFAGAPWVHTFVNNYRMIGQGPGNNLLVHETWHLTVNANNEVTAVVSNIKFECK